MKYRDLQTFAVVEQLTAENYSLRQELDYWRHKAQVPEPRPQTTQDHHTSRSGRLARHRKRSARSGKSMVSSHH